MQDLIQHYFNAFNRGDIAGMLELLDENIAHDVNQGKSQVGRNEFEIFLNHMDNCYKEELKDIVIMTSPQGKNASAEFMVHGTYLKTDGNLPPARNQQYIIRAGTFFEVKNNKISRVSTFYNLGLWMEMVK